MYSPSKSSVSQFPARAVQRGASASAFVLGLVLGLVIALVVALYITKAELPFSNAKTQADSPKLSPGPNQNPPDPNGAIYGRTGGNAPGQSNGAVAPVESQTPAAPAPAAPITGITSTTNAPAAAPPAAQPVPQVQYYLQLGSFRNREDAENLRARLAFVGTESEIAVGEVNGDVVNRVRVGPFNNANEAYQARVPLTKAGFEATVVKQ